jgi:hypothetical protein
LNFLGNPILRSLVGTSTLLPIQHPLWRFNRQTRPHSFCRPMYQVRSKDEAHPARTLGLWKSHLSHWDREGKEGSQQG